MISNFVDWSYHSQVITSIKTLCFLIKHVFALGMIMLDIEKVRLWDCFRFLKIESHILKL